MNPKYENISNQHYIQARVENNQNSPLRLSRNGLPLNTKAMSGIYNQVQSEHFRVIGKTPVCQTGVLPWSPLFYNILTFPKGALHREQLWRPKPPPAIKPTQK